MYTNSRYLEVVMDILQRIKQIREARKMSVYELAGKSEISRNTICRWYTQNYTQTLDTLQIICEKGFETSLVEFFAVDCELIPVTKDFMELINIWTTLNATQK